MYKIVIKERREERKENPVISINGFVCILYTYIILFNVPFKISELIIRSAAYFCYFVFIVVALPETNTQKIISHVKELNKKQKRKKRTLLVSICFFFLFYYKINDLNLLINGDDYWKCVQIKCILSHTLFHVKWIF